MNTCTRPRLRQPATGLRWADSRHFTVLDRLRSANNIVAVTKLQIGPETGFASGQFEATLRHPATICLRCMMVLGPVLAQ